MMLVPSATTALVSALRPVGAEHRAVRLAVSLLDGDEPPLVAAVVGPSGVGKSTLVNHLAEEQVAEVGVLRPTTVETTAWTTPDGLLRLIDAPPSDQLPGPGLAPIDGADVAVVVTSQARYADATTWACVRQAREVGVPVIIVVNRLEGAVADLIRDEIADRAGETPVIVVGEGTVAEDLADLRSLLTSASADIPALRSLRRHSVAGPAASATRALALQARIDGERAAVLAEAVADAEAEAGTPVPLGAEAAGGTEDDLTDVVCAAIDHAASSLTLGLAGVWESLGLAVPADATPSARQLDDRVAVERWRIDTVAAFTAAVRPRWLLRIARDSIADDAWRLSVDSERPVRRWVRIGIGAGADALRAERAGALSGAISERVAARIEAFAAAVPPPIGVDPDRLEALAGKLEDEHPPAPIPPFLIAVGA